MALFHFGKPLDIILFYWDLHMLGNMKFHWEFFFQQPDPRSVALLKEPPVWHLQQTVLLWRRTNVPSHKESQPHGRHKVFNTQKIGDFMDGLPWLMPFLLIMNSKSETWLVYVMQYHPRNMWGPKPLFLKSTKSTSTLFFFGRFWSIISHVACGPLN